MNNLTPLIPLASLQPLSPIQSISGLNSLRSVPGNQGTGFGQYLNNAINQLNDLQVNADYQTNLLLTGDVEDFHTPIIALEKASLGLGLATSLRNKLLEAYQEIMRMQI